MKRTHIVFRREEYVAGTRDRPEVGVFTQSHTTRPPVPWNRVSAGDEVLMKWSGGPIVGAATVQGCRQFADCSPEMLREATRGSGLYDLTAYWQSLHSRFFAVVVYLELERWLDKPIEAAQRSYGESWIVLESADAVQRWLYEAPGGANRGTHAGANQRRKSRTIPLSLRFEVLRRDGFACRYCGRRPPEVKLHLDHSFPWSRGGQNSLDNLYTACEECNLGKGSRFLSA